MEMELCIEIALIDGPQVLDEIFEDWRLKTPKIDPLFGEKIIWVSQTINLEADRKTTVGILQGGSGEDI